MFVFVLVTIVPTAQRLTPEYSRSTRNAAFNISKPSHKLLWNPIDFNSKSLTVDESWNKPKKTKRFLPILLVYNVYSLYVIRDDCDC